MFLNINDYIVKLQSSGLIISNNSDTREKLLKSNPYNVINGFREPFIISSTNPKRYKNGASFKEIYSLYIFDYNLRKTILDFALEIENDLKSKFSYELAKSHGENSYLSTSIYTFNKHIEKTNVLKTLYEISSKIEKKKRSNVFQFCRKRKRNTNLGSS